jgi:DNA primase
VILRTLPASLATTLSKAQAIFQAQFSGSLAENYAVERGLGTATVHKDSGDVQTNVAREYGLGYVGPDGLDLPGFESWRNLLTIPNYNRRGVVVGIKGRSLDPEPEHKYLNVSGGSNYLFNLYATKFPSDTIVLTEGEIDALTVIGHLGLPAVAVPGVSNWRPWHARIFEDYEHVVMLRDNDSAGSQLVGEIRASLPETVVITPRNKDVNEDVMAGLASELRARIDEALREDD